MFLYKVVGILFNELQAYYALICSHHTQRTQVQGKNFLAGIRVKSFQCVKTRLASAPILRNRNRITFI